MLPGLQKTVLLPAGMRVASLSVLPQQPVLVAVGAHSAPIPPPDPGEEGPLFGGEPSPEFYGPGGSFPPRFELLVAKSAYWEFRLAQFVAFPLEWRADGGCLFLYRSLRVHLSLEMVGEDEGPPPRLRPEAPIRGAAGGHVRAALGRALGARAPAAQGRLFRAAEDRRLRGVPQARAR